MRPVAAAALVTLLALALAACGGDGPVEVAPGPAVEGFELTAESALRAGAPIDPRHTCDGEDVSPAIAWRGVPAGTRELALVVDDAEADGFTHWLVFGMREDATTIPEGVPPEGKVEGPTPLRQGRNDSGGLGWAGPCPPQGETHTYVLRLLALDSRLGLEPTSDRGDFDRAVRDRIIGEVRLEAIYARP
jgi:Raf kinase inhibitor-like YbhB/YbcL family protein